MRKGRVHQLTRCIARAKLPVMSNEPRTLRKVVSFAPSEWGAVDDWMDKNRIRVEAEAIRRLIELGLEAAREEPGEKAS
jgi:hypothetical protein